MKPVHQFSVLVLAAVFILILCPFFGAEKLKLEDLFVPLSASHRIFFELRLPRVVLTLVVGGSLAMLGGTYQSLLQNPLADPYILGVSSAVTLAAASAELFFKIPSYSFVGVAIGFVAAWIVTCLLIGLSLSRTGAVDRLILFGIGINFVLSSLLFLILSYFSQQMGGGSLRWLFGQISWITLKESFLFLAVCFPFVMFISLYSRALDALSLGDGVARTLGYSPERIRIIFLMATSVLVSLIVSVTGAIGFVGLVIPHGVRLIFHPSTNRTWLHLSFLAGGVFLCLSDVFSRLILPPFEFPIGIVTTLIGGPLFLFLLWKRS